MTGSYIDYETFLDEDFKATAFANTLVQATNSPTDATIDLQTPKKKVVYDLYEIRSLIKKVSEDNSAKLLSTLTTTSAAEDSLMELKTTLSHVNAAYAKLRHDFLVPYTESQQLLQGLKRLNQTTALLRSTTWYLQLASTLASQASSLEGVVALNQIRAYLASQPQLRGLEIIRLHETQALPVLENKLVNWATQMIQSLSPVSNQRERQEISRALRALYLLQPNVMIRAVKSLVMGKVKESVAAFRRGAVTLASIETALYESSKRGKVVMILTEILANEGASEGDGSSARLDEPNQSNQSQKLATLVESESSEDSKSLLDIVYDTTKDSLMATYYKNLSLGLSNYLKDAVVGAPYTPGAKSVLNNVKSLETTVKDCVIKSGNGYLTENSMELKVMLGAIRVLR